MLPTLFARCSLLVAREPKPRWPGRRKADAGSGGTGVPLAIAASTFGGTNPPSDGIIQSSWSASSTDGLRQREATTVAHCADKSSSSASPWGMSLHRGRSANAAVDAARSSTGGNRPTKCIGTRRSHSRSGTYLALIGWAEKENHAQIETKHTCIYYAGTMQLCICRAAARKGVPLRRARARARVPVLCDAIKQPATGTRGHGNTVGLWGCGRLSRRTEVLLTYVITK